MQLGGEGIEGGSGELHAIAPRVVVSKSYSWWLEIGDDFVHKQTKAHLNILFAHY